MENKTKPESKVPEINLSQKERILELASTALCFLVLVASFMKVLFF
jgi:hypothetical protein